jgi:hypothetical protein
VIVTVMVPGKVPAAPLKLGFSLIVAVGMMFGRSGRPSVWESAKRSFVWSVASKLA